jgi:hypothetical protein
MVPQMFPELFRWEREFEGKRSKMRCRLGYTDERDLLIVTPAGEAVIPLTEIEFIVYMHKDQRAVIGADDDSVHKFGGGGKSAGSLHRLTHVLG